MIQLLPFLLFAFVASITPGPTNLLAMSSSARFGLLLGWIGALWLSYLGWQITQAPSTIDATTKGERPLSGWATALMQLINPKPWTVALAVVSVFVTSTGAPAWLLALLFLLIAVPCMLLWAWLGLKAGRWLQTGIKLQRFNQVMGLLLAISGWLSLLS